MALLLMCCVSTQCETVTANNTDAENDYPEHTDADVYDLNYDFWCDLYLFLALTSWFKENK
ncbi:hypothetical protein [Dickeya dianthicola]|uniref:hypothetical protein n=1 Tax=Dickeya dianthicola TaxID=204039 RepID=UPI0011C23543|nr:hypothetical protein [Dickeya dianthicola]MBI0450540.1 hypothetical protein [Dickeya dianthicola]MBI0458361.1 hypothetical protein [Dickeya dianthicola]MBI0480002.1 hypothetical protein [Dickeya dianthicola]MBI0487432.1 hypothetical protein [Dickeya dianthicola]MBI0503692.1 hypothetical protein [Dickeya dianthicola]